VPSRAERQQLGGERSRPVIPTSQFCPCCLQPHKLKEFIGNLSFEFDGILALP